MPLLTTLPMDEREMVTIISTWVVISIVMITAVISLCYISTIKKRFGYRALDLIDGEANVVTEMEDIDGEVVYVIVYREKEIASEEKLHQAAEVKVHERFPNHCYIPIDMTKEPGFGAHHTWAKQSKWFSQSLKLWSGSVFHTMVAPLELFIRATVFPLWALLDFITRDRKAVAAICTKARIPPSLRRVTLIEGYETVYVAPLPPLVRPIER